MNITWLNRYPDIRNMLDRDGATVRVLGGVQEKEDSFLNTVAGICDNKQTFNETNSSQLPISSSDEKLARAAKEKMGWSPALTEAFLIEHPDVAKLIAADLGEATAVLTEDAATTALTVNFKERIEDEVYARLAEKAASQFQDAPSLDEEFFKDHPKAALYILKNPEESRRLDVNRAAQRDFHDHVTEYEALVEPVEEAKVATSGNYAIGSKFWEDNPDLALILVAEKAADMGNHLQETSLGYPDEYFEEVTPHQLISRDQARKAKTHLGEDSPFGMDYLREHNRLSRLINERPEFAANLKQDERLMDFFESDDVHTVRVIQAYISGLPGRDSSSWHRWA